MTPELRHCFSITIQVDKPVIVSRSPQTGKRQLIPPMLAGWLPDAIFFVLGLVLLRRIR